MYTRSIAIAKHNNDLLNNILLGNEKVAHCLVELSSSHYRRMTDNMIMVSGFININQPYYDSVKYGNNIRFCTLCFLHTEEDIDSAFCLLSNCTLKYILDIIAIA